MLLERSILEKNGQPILFEKDLKNTYFSAKWVAKSKEMMVKIRLHVKRFLCGTTPNPSELFLTITQRIHKNNTNQKLSAIKRAKFQFFAEVSPLWWRKDFYLHNVLKTSARNLA